MRTLSATALEKLRTRLGNEPIVILEIQWYRDGGWSLYADRDISNIVQGKILDVSDLDDVVAVSENNDSQEITVTLDDTDGTIKTIFDTTDIHKRDVKVWQWFEGLSIDDRFLLFRGKINSPIVWNEGDQTVTFSIISQIEDKEFGFSPEEGQFPYIPVDLIGKPWPSCFGTPLDVPCVAIGKAIHGTSLAGVGILTGSGFYSGVGFTAEDVQIARSTAIQNVQKAHVSYVASAWVGIDEGEYNKYNDQRTQLADSITKAWASRLTAKQKQAEDASRRIAEVLSKGLGSNPITILGGENFPRGSITLNINGGLFTGFFGNNTGVDDDLFTITSRYHPENEAAYNDELEEAQKGEVVVSSSPGGTFDFNSKVPCGSGNFYNPCQYQTEGFIYTSPYTVSKSATVIPKYFWAAAGSGVTLYGLEPITYIASIVPGTVLAVKAFKTFNGVQHLVEVPSDYYYVETKQYGPITAVQVVFYKTLSTLVDENWTDNVYVTFQSDVGPNIVDILEYIIDTYTEFAVDTASFDHVRERLEPFPANFAVLDRKNVIQILEEIAFQARCSLRLINDVFYLTYLPEEPTSIETITESDIEFNSVTVSGSPTEDLVTKFDVKWRITYAQNELNTLVLRHNIGYYGVHEAEYEFYIYNQPDIVLKAATFWLIRKANTWKHIKLRTFIHKLNIETLDCVTLKFEKPYVANSEIKGIVREAKFNSSDQTIDIECWLPVKFGTMIAYDFAWPADTPAQWIYPTDDEVHWGHSGGAWIGEDAEGTLPLGEIKDTLDSEKQFLSGEQMSISRIRHDSDKRNHDAGDRHPSDRDFSAQSVSSPSRGGGGFFGGGPLTSPITPPQPQPTVPPREIPLVNDGLILDLSHTKVRDSEFSETAVGYLGDFLHFDSGGEFLCLRSDTYIWDAEGGSPEGPFDFQYDDEGSVWGAGTAWLKP